MHTSLAVVALSGLFAPSATPENPHWLRDYAAARKEGRREHKPLAVFVGSGRVGWEGVSREGKLGGEVRNLLASNYVCVYLDTRQKEGERLARAFEITDGLGIVISDRTGDLQAFRHEGDLANDDLERYLERYADPDLVVRSTDSNPGTEEPPAPVVVPTLRFGGFGGGC